MSILHQTEVSDGPDEEIIVPNKAEASIKQLEELELPSEDGVPLESNWHRIQMNLLIDSVNWLWRDRKDFFAGGNMFVYFNLEQALNRDFRGPDFFVVKDTDGERDRDSWIVWLENGRYPSVIVELASPSTIQIDLGLKKTIYEKRFRTSDYFVYDPKRERLHGWHLSKYGYVPLGPDRNGRMRCRELGVDIGLWEGEIFRVNTRWVRLFDTDGNLVPTEAEAKAQLAESEALRADSEAQRADAETERAEKAEAELERLRKELALLRQG